MQETLVISWNSHEPPFCVQPVTLVLELVTGDPCSDAATAFQTIKEQTKTPIKTIPVPLLDFIILSLI
jgi:hypothetical protein